MFAIIGIVVVLGAIIGGFLMEKGNMAVLLQPAELLMVGNSLKSDILPVLNVGGYGVHVPYHITWAHEHIEHSIDDEKFKSVEGIRDILGFL